MKVLLGGASGFVGRHLAAHLGRNGHTVRTLGRSGADHDWSPASLAAGVAATDAVVHLAGENVLARRWSAAQKERLRTSRLATTDALARALAVKGGQGVFVTASAIGYYGPHGDEPIDENSPTGRDFLAGLCRDWEAATAPAARAGVRCAQVRIGLVLGTDGGALARMLLPFRLGLGGPLGHGRQMQSWIHVEDLCALFRFVLESPAAHGPFNGTAPTPVTQREFARTLGRVLGRPAFLPLPAFVLRLGLGEAAGLLLDGVAARPQRALAAGFRFAHPELEGALRALLAR
jgi:uncharacterized protein (TIGR01777 family)